jgi:hypothetical protein
MKHNERDHLQTHTIGFILTTSHAGYMSIIIYRPLHRVLYIGALSKYSIP